MLPARMREIRATPIFWFNKEMPNMAREAIEEVPAARPSKPSRRLMALVIATTQKIVAGIDQIPRLKVPNGNEISSILQHICATMRPARIWNRNFTLGGSLLKSSMDPSPRMMVEAKKIHPKRIPLRKSGGKWKKANCGETKRTRWKAMKMENPPSLGMGRV